MNHASWAEMQQNPNPNPNSSLLVVNTTNYSVSYSHDLSGVPFQPPGIDPHAALFQPQPQPPGIDQPYVPPPVTLQYAQQPVSYEAQPQTQPLHVADPAATATATAADLYYQNASWVAAGVQFGGTSYAATSTAPVPTIQSQTRNIWKKGLKRTKVVQSAWCEVCKIDCNSKGVLDQHKLGKKHKKILEKLLAPTTTIPASTVVSYSSPITSTPIIPTAVVAPAPLYASASVPVAKPIIGPQENPDKLIASNASKKRKKAIAARSEDLETKTRKVLEGGAEAKSVRLCNICNVVCNSDTVFNFHLAGQKHQSMVRKLTSAARIASAM